MKHSSKFRNFGIVTFLPKSSLQYAAAGILMASLLIVGQKLLPSTLGDVGRSFLIISSGIAFLFSFTKNESRFTSLATGFLGLTALYAAYSFGHVYLHLFRDPKEWDFLCYFLDGKVVSGDLNFYLPESFKTIAAQVTLPYSPSQEFQTEIIGVGFGLNPPPSMFMFLPLGYFSYSQALILWTSFISLCFIGAISLSIPVFFTEKRIKVTGILFVVTIALLWAPSRKTLTLGQTNFFALFMLMLFWWKAKAPVSGIVAALAMFVKPILLVLPGILLIRRNWKAFGYAIGTSALLSLLSILVFGWETFFSFFTQLPTTHVSNLVLSERQNQSLMASVIRAGKYTEWGDPYLLIFLSCFILALSAYFVFKTHKKHIGWAISVALTGFLMVYPGTLHHYGVLLLPVLVFFLCEWKELPGTYGRVGCFLAIMAIILLTGTFWANLIAWILSLGISAYKIANLPK